MATRRGASKETAQPIGAGKILHPKDEKETVEYRTLPGGVLWKFVLYSVMIVVCPLATYFLTVNTVFEGQSTYAGASAAAVANVILIIYIIFAIREDMQNEKRIEASSKKDT